MTKHEINDKDILALFEQWNSALQTGLPSEVVALYCQDAVLLPTISNDVRRSHSEIEDYFELFLARKPVGKIDQCSVRLHGDIAINSGVYTFSFDNEPDVQARFTFVYRNTGNRWMIIEHHSSQMPE
ncbi:hypothetical protein GCM10011369_27050 [Neiella marina]|uniref:Calcium/calmodulin-dependent protein kinase II association-domain domain-containing protein n=1 Tax=Neiella marina TaxID=508461 RepID=A0A8J2XQ76_9GAMM|nr:SgcJ/EcaC family oxidoreductase [Neiella marina]GGA83620.1 hypothetical protein GCM10011369_27050 [Neiella marina]